VGRARTLAAGIGTVTAFGAIGFVELLHFAEFRAIDLLQRTPWWFLPLVPMAGALLTGLLVHFFASEARGHGVPEVMDALYRKKARIRPRVALVKSLASACTIGSGGSAGAEGPIVQIGSAIGSGLATLLRVPRDQAGTLLGCGAAAGIASVFNAPIAGIFFVLEILLRDFSLRTFTPIVVASVFSTMTTQAYYGENDAIFAVSEVFRDTYEFTYPELPSYLLLGGLCGLVAVGFIRLLYLSEDLYDKLRIHPVIKPVSGALVLGLLGIVYLQLIRAEGGSGELPPFFGNGYDTIRDLLRPENYDVVISDAITAAVANTGGLSVVPTETIEPVSTALWMLLVLLMFKAVATCLTLGSGGSGGVFAPSLFLGAAAGALLGVTLDTIGLLPDGGSPAAYALVGMAAVVAGTTHAPLTAILILFELTRDVYVLLPIMIAAIVSVLIAQAVLRDSVYTLKLRRRGVLVGSMADLTILRRLTARSIRTVPHVAVHPEDPLSKLLDLRGSYHVTDFVVVDHDGQYVGMVTGQDVRTALIEREAIPYLLVEEVVRRDLPTIDPEETLDIVLEKFSKYDVASLPMLDGGQTGGQVAGLITRARLMSRYRDALAEP
jgi:CIC family chloride channel protein